MVPIASASFSASGWPTRARRAGTAGQASYAWDGKEDLLRQANDGIELTRWIVRMAHDRKLLAPKQFELSAIQLNECGRMVGGWLRSR